ncbi:MAG TPA: NUDIX domain-containing protein [Acidimicrobiales bacterium]|nr:NUDIX domain-containing protein [Acidimicrobiales bacterium]
MSRGAGRPVDGCGSTPDLVDAVRATVDAHRPADEREAEAIGQVAAALGILERPFDEHAAPEHLTGSAVVVGPRGTVLHMHKRLHRWLQPGGHIDVGEAPWEAALRESQEETGLVLAHPAGGPRLIHVDVHRAAKGHTHFDLRYLLLAPDRDPAPPPGESPEARWFAWDEAAGVADEALAGALRAARRQPELRPRDAAVGEPHRGPGDDGRSPSGAGAVGTTPVPGRMVSDDHATVDTGRHEETGGR